MDNLGVRLGRPQAGRQQQQSMAASVGGSVFDSCSPGQGHEQIMAHFCLLPPPPLKGVLQLYTRILTQG